MSKVAYLIAAISRYTTVPDNDTRVFSIAIVNNDSEIATAAAMGATTTNVARHFSTNNSHILLPLTGLAVK